MKPPQYYSRFARTAATKGGNLPHWSQCCATFTTFRLADSLPVGKLEQMRAERDEWLRVHIASVRAPVDAASSPRQNKDATTASPVDGSSYSDAARPPRPHVADGSSYSDAARTPRPRAQSPYASLISLLSAEELDEYRELFSRRFHAWLDAGYGSCVLRDARVRSVVEEVLQHFADVRYSLYGYVVKPNHVHALFMPEEGFDCRAIVADWKSYSAHAVNRLLGRKGPLWQKESYDHLVRDADEFNGARIYIRQNDPALAYDSYA